TVDSLRETCFRGSIARPSHGLSTLHRTGRPDRCKTHFWLRARLYQVGLVTHRVPSKGFRVVPVTSLPPFPGFTGRKNDRSSDGDDAGLLPPTTRRRYDGVTKHRRPIWRNPTWLPLYHCSSASTTPRTPSNSVSSTPRAPSSATARAPTRPP